MNLMDDPDFTAALTEAETLQKKPRAKPPTRFAARALIVALGESLLDGDDASAAVTRVRALVDGNRDGWTKALHEDLSLATTEHVRSCDPRYLKLPNYDFPYTVAARHRLEARLRAMGELECPVDEILLEQIERADRELAPYLEQDSETPPSKSTPPPRSRPS